MDLNPYVVLGSAVVGLLGWSRRRRTAEIRRYLDFAAANVAALTAPPVVAGATDAAVALTEPSDEVPVPA